MADVSVEALSKIKQALITFQGEIAGLQARTAAQEQTCLTACRRSVEQTQAKVDELEGTVKKLQNTAADLEAQIASAQNEIRQLEDSVPRMEKQLQQTEDSIARLQHQIAALQAQLAQAEDDRVRQNIQGQINAANRQLESLYHTRTQLQVGLHTAADRKKALYGKVDQLKAEKAHCEEQLTVSRKRRAQYQQKSERLRSLQDAAKSALEEYTGAARKFEGTVHADVGQNVRTIDRCITYIEAYLAQSL